MFVFKQLLREFAVPFLTAVAWTIYNLYEVPKETWSISSTINIFGPTFFFVSWLAAQWFRVRKQQKIDAGLLDIDQSIKHSVVQLEQRTTDLVNYITGGDSICYLCGPETTSDIWSPLLLIHVGKHPMYDVKVRMVDIDIPIDRTAGSISLDDLAKREWSRSFGDLVPGHSKVLSEALDLSAAESHRFNLFFSARNGSFHQLLRCKKIGGTWMTAVQVWRNNNIVFEHVSDGYPRNSQGAVEWEA